MSREKHYFEIYSPEYNILKTPGSPDRGSGWRHSEATIENMRVIASNRSPEFLDKLSKNNSSSIAVEVTDLETNTTTIYHAIKAAARALKIDKRYIENYIYLKKDKPVLGKYVFKINSDNKITNLLLSLTRFKTFDFGNHMRVVIYIFLVWLKLFVLLKEISFVLVLGTMWLAYLSKELDSKVLTGHLPQGFHSVVYVTIAWVQHKDIINSIFSHIFTDRRVP